MNLKRTPAPPPQMMGYLVVQGLVVVLLGDLAIATIRNEPTTVRSVCEAAGIVKKAAEFDVAHLGVET
ncbi:hypothetical protein LTR62_002873 [Meristemomyces frigidus]|uniref:Uncharacterized protein n=1 Tax=Meristemomyces frigidus TaxID=1508187 RepID=A0AAN7TIN8_9PEZI|nr:hypothetical protein LTR62_002873 [Meristemomyces frigidus]